VSSAFELFLFTPDPDFAARAVVAGVHGIVIDWERVGKEERQEAADTEINLDTVEDLIRVRAATSARILCRINPVGSGTAGEIDAAASAGADEVLVPMVRTPGDVEVALELAHGRVGIGILVETVEALGRADALGRLPLSRVYVGLNDLRIERGSPSIFTAVLDGTVERVRAASRVPFGFAGLTLPEAGDPIPCRLLAAELARLRCNFTFLRRSFRRDVAGRELEVEIPRMHDALRVASARSRAEIARDRAELELRIAEHEAEAALRRAHAHA
jgi:HpcH/HpaI aldolase/citrate lyase family